MMLVGVLWAIFAPLGLLIIAGLIATALRRFGRWIAIAAASIVTLVPVALLWSGDHAEFSSVCAQTRAKISSTGKADGILLNSETANSFGTRYIYDEGFSWFEARDIYNREKWVRYQREPDGRITSHPVVTPEAHYEVRETYARPFTHTGLTVVSVIDRTNGVELGHAGNAQFDGGRAKWLLGAWGSSQCPSGMLDPEGFRAFYHLAHDTLR